MENKIERLHENINKYKGMYLNSENSINVLEQQINKCKKETEAVNAKYNQEINDLNNALKNLQVSCNNIESDIQNQLQNNQEINTNEPIVTNEALIKIKALEEKIELNNAKILTQLDIVKNDLLVSITSFIEKLTEIKKEEEDSKYINDLLGSLIKIKKSVTEYNITEGGITNFRNILENILENIETIMLNKSIFFISEADISVLYVSLNKFIEKYKNDEKYENIINNIINTVNDHNENNNVHTFISKIIDILNNIPQDNTEKVPNTEFFTKIANTDETFYVFYNMLEKYNKYENINAILQSNITDIVNLSEQITNLHELAIKKKYLKYKNKYLSLKKRVKNL